MDLHSLFALSSLLVIVLYAILVFRNVEPLAATAICVGVGFLFNLSSPIEMAKTLEGSLSSFLALVGFIIMLGRGLGEVLHETKVSHTLVYKIIYGIGVNTQRKVKIGIVFSSIVIVAVLGTLAGGLAIIAPILRPVAAKVKLSRPSFAVLMQASGEEALILGPFAPPVVALLGVTGISYPTMLLHASIPIACVTVITTWLMAGKLQKMYPDEVFEEENIEAFVPSKKNNLVTFYFIFAFIGCVIGGMLFQAKTSFVIFVMLFLAISTGLLGGISFSKILDLVVEGMKKNFQIFFIFLLLDPFLNLVEQAGGFKAFTDLITPLANFGGSHMLAVIVGVTGAFGMPAASAAVIKMLYSMFNASATHLGLSITTFAFSMLLATRITNFAYPGANMFATMGFAESKNIKAMIFNGLTVTLVQVVFLIIYSVIF